MNSGLYAAYLGMRARQHTLDVFAHNIANASTVGFKASRLFYRSVEAAEIAAERARQQAGAQNTGAAPAGAPPTTLQSPPGSANAQPVTIPPANNPAAAEQAAAPATLLPARTLGIVTSGVLDFSPGSLRDTGRPLDLALDGDGFLEVQTPRGVRYTRAGSLTLNADGQLVTRNGDLIVGQGGPLTARPGELTIGADGTISSNGQVAGQLKLVRFTNPRAALKQEGEALFVATGAERPQEAPQTRVVQGALEMSNVDVVSEMAAMMQNSRDFDALQNSITLMMSARKLAAEIGRI
jgi:flagellar basal-body rod protein FlgF